MNYNNLMMYIDKYRESHRLDGDPKRRWALTAFQSIIDGTAHWDAVFVMNPDDEMKKYLDDEDFARWQNAKRAHSAN